ncbi:hypothetical protein MHTCC0001_19970 [Flavobacteriaceae bacterium MHTCC 0001]
MANCDTDIATHKTSGSKQSERMLKALYADFVLLDERSIAQLIVSTNTLSEHINFFDKNNVLVDNWDTFFKWETTSILAQITRLNAAELAADFQLKKRELLFLSALADQQEVILPFFETIVNMVDDLWKRIEKLPNDFDIKAYFVNTKVQVSGLSHAILDELNNATDLVYTLQHHLFNKKVQNLFGLLQQWHVKSEAKLNENLESYPKHSPQYALYLAFLKLFGFAQDNLNEFTQRHLDFYYNKILNLYPEDAESDTVHLCIEPHKTEPAFLIEKDSIFRADKDSDGNQKYYKPTADLVVNQAKTAVLYGSAIKNNTYYFQDSTALNDSGDSWKAFPYETVYNDIGFAIATPLLYLRGGHRTIAITFTNAVGKKVPVLPEHFNFYVSGAEDWHLASADYEKGVTTLTIPSDVEGIMPFNPEIHSGVALNTVFPVLKIVTKAGKLTNPAFTKINLDITVTDYNQFKFFNNYGEMDHTKSFEPYGPLPKNGNALIFACKEFFQKKDAKGHLKIISDNTAGDGLDMISISRFTFLDQGIWLAEDHWDGSKTYPFTNKSVMPYDFSEDENISPNDSSGFAKFILDDTAYIGNTYLNSYITESKTENSTTLPYLPNILEVLFDYTVSAELAVANIGNSDNYQIYNIYPKGYTMPKASKIGILPKLVNEGELFIGIEKIEGGNSLSLLFQVAEGTANPRQTAIELQWQYLYGTEWKGFDLQDIGDDTNGLTQSGIVTLNSPEDLKLQEQTELPSTYWWIKIIAAERIDAICDLVGIHDQALKATLTDVELNGTGFTAHTDAGTISKLQHTNTRVKKINQPYISFGGKLKEEQDPFYQRTSERLRHKGRAITSWDYEKLVLDKFPEVHQVKCLNHHRYDSLEINNSSAGYVTLIPVAQANTTNVPNYWKPLVDLGTMKRIESYIKQIASPHIRLAVKAPKLEQLELDFKVKYIEIPGADTRLYQQQLQDAINAFLSPWAYDDTVGVNFQKTLEKSVLIHFIEQQTIVDYITDFKVNQLILDDASETIVERRNDIDTIVPKTAYSLFIPHTHRIHTLTTECCL